MEKRLGFTLDQRQVEQACVAFITSRLQADEEAKATAHVVMDDDKGPTCVACQITVTKKRKPRIRKKNGSA